MLDQILLFDTVLHTQRVLPVCGVCVKALLIDLCHAASSSAFLSRLSWRKLTASPSSKINHDHIGENVYSYFLSLACARIEFCTCSARL